MSAVVLAEPSAFESDVALQDTVLHALEGALVGTLPPGGWQDPPDDHSLKKLFAFSYNQPGAARSSRTIVV